MASEKQLIYREDLLTEYDRVHIGPPGGARKLIAEAPTVDAVELPCRIGNVVWGIKKCNQKYVAKRAPVTQMFFVENMRLCICVKDVCRGEWGKKVFATKEEAEAALAERNGDGF